MEEGREPRSSPSWSRRRCSWCSASTSCSRTRARSSAPSTTRSSSTSATTSPPQRLRRGPRRAARPRARHPAHRGRGRGRRGDGRVARVPARGAPPHQAAEQGRLGAARAVPPATAVRWRARYGYRRFDGSGDDDEIDAEALLEALTDDLLEGGDLSDALNSLLRRGMRTDDGERLEGLRDADGAGAPPPPGAARARGPRRAVRRVPRPARRRRAHRARGARVRSPRRRASSGDERRQQVTDDVVAERSVALDVMPDRFADRVDAMRHYEFVSSEAREQFEQLLAELRDQLLGSYFESLKGALSEPDPEQLRAPARGDGRAQPDARAARARRGPRPDLRGVHGPVRRPVRPGRLPRRAPGEPRAPDGRGARDVRLALRRTSAPSSSGWRGRCSRTWTSTSR